MKKNFTFLFLFFWTVNAVVAQDAKKMVTAADYEKATKFLGTNTSKLVDRNDVRPNWLPDGNLWYVVTVNGAREYVHINTKDGKRKSGKDLKSILPNAVTESNSGGGRRSSSLEVVSPDGKKAVFIREFMG